MNAMRIALPVLLAGVLALAACASSPTVPAGNGFVLEASGGISNSVPDEPFYDWLDDLEKKTRADPDYKRIPLGNAVWRDTVIGWLHATYRQLITPEQFKQRMLTNFPGHEYEVDFILASLPPVSQR